ncbi:MAG: glycosyltransferase family 4 protein [Dysgonamonadaceae bacterium]|jgi:glycosyltransferase involved in cell wall biosynthesis|nr:glycosyltransferase family 4 protein [Dysgonamonadaceae bacterium]
MDKKKVLIDLGDLGDVHCGFGQIAFNYGKLFSALDLDDIEFVFLVPKKYKGYYGDGVKYVVKKKIYKYFPFLLPKVDVWHSVHQRCKTLRLAKETKYVFTIHDLNFLYEKSPFKIKKYIRMVQRGINRADVVTTISGFTADEVRNNLNLNGKSIKVVYNGVERIDEMKDTQPAFMKNPERPFFFTIGQIRRKKNFHVLLDVMKDFPDHDLYIAGESHRRYAIEIAERIEKENITNVFLSGICLQEEKVWLYRNCRAFLFPSLFEGFGLPAIEAMRFGKPVFAAASTSLPEICAGHACMWDNFEPEYLIKSIRQFLNQFDADPQKAEKEIEYAHSFDYRKHIDAYVSIYRSLIHSA